MTSILVVEDNVILATAIVRFLRDHGDLNVSAVVPSAELALVKIKEIPVDLVLVDIALPGMSGIDLIAVLNRQYPHLPCLVLSAHNEVAYVRQAFDAGAKGYVMKGDALAILAAIEQVLKGESYLSDELRQKLLH